MLQKRFLIASVLTMFGTAAFLGGCGSASKESGAQSATATTTAATIDNTSVALDTSKVVDAATLAGTINGVPVTAENTTSCYTCHGTSGLFKTTAKTVGLAATGTGWTLSTHANQGTHVDAADPLCVACHDPFGDGAKLTAARAKGSQVPVTSATVVGCEACHGGGSMHRGIGTLPATKPSIKRCGSCHGKQWSSDAKLASHKTYHPEGDGIYDDFITSPHAKSINSHVLVSGSTTDVTAKCARCHTDEGAKAYLPTASGTLDYAGLGTAMSGKANIAAASSVQCRTCHDPHTGKLLGTKDPVIAALPWSDEFKTCTACHQMLKTDGSKAEAYHDKAVNAYGDDKEIITDTHISVAGTPGYRIDPTSSRACSNCHNPHNADNTINNQYAKAAHFSPTGAAWVRYGDSNSTSCARCHSTSGFIGYIDAIKGQTVGSTGNTALAAPAPSPAIATGAKQMLYCNGCHSNNKGGLRTLPYFQYNITTTAEYLPNYTDATATSATGVSRTIPSDIGASLLCASCHAGRKTAQSTLKNAAAPTSVTAEHYLATASIMYRLDAYEYTGTGITYDNSSFKHDTIGTSGSSAPGNGNGPCVGCHMFPGSAKANHEFKVFERDATNNAITSVLADASTCSKCHTGAGAKTAALLNAQEAQYNAAIQAFRSVLAKKAGIYYNIADGKFYTASAQATAATSATWGTAITVASPPATIAAAKNKLGAGYNLNLLSYALKGAAALYHNPKYAQRIIYDSIDYLDDGLLNGSVAATIADIAIIPATTATSYKLKLDTDFNITDADRALALQYLGNTRP